MRPSFRLGFLTHLRGSGDIRQIYRDAVELFVAAEELGFEVGWVAQHHFKPGSGHLPAPFPFLAAVAERTRRIRLGTSIVVLPLERPLRVAEDAAVVDLLSDGRLELGVGSGSDPQEFVPFEVDISTRHQRTSEGLEQIRRALRGETWGEEALRLEPPAPSLVERIWLSGLSPMGATYAAKNDAGLLLSRAAWGREEPTDEVQSPVAQTYLDSWQHDSATPRIALSRGIYLATDRQAALKEMQADMTSAIEGMVKRGTMAAGLSLEAYCERFHISYGHPEEVAASLQADRVLSRTTDLILQLDPVRPPLDATIGIFEQVATQVAPALGWEPGRHTG